MEELDQQIKMLQKGADEIVGFDELKEKLKKSKEKNIPLTIKLGLDPTAPDIHIGHAVVLRKLRQFQSMGHNVILIIGDFTGMIGDPTGKSKTRKQLTETEVLKNAKTYEEQVFKILDKEKTQLTFNSKWLNNLSFKDAVNILSKYNVARMLEREDFKKRFSNHQSIALHEFMYPLVQGYDSVALKADVELGGTDQRFNILVGRHLQKEFGMEQQVAIFMPLLEGIDGIDKMSKSLGNYVGINESPNIMFEKIMKIPDNIIIRYYNLATDLHPNEICTIEKELNNGKNPRDVKLHLSREIVKLYHGEKAATESEEYFISVYSKNIIPEGILEIELDKNVVITDALIIGKMASSKSEARRLVSQGGVKINGKKIEDIGFNNFSNDQVVSVGKGKFFKVIIK